VVSDLLEKLVQPPGIGLDGRLVVLAQDVLDLPTDRMLTAGEGEAVWAPPA
jgi:hypothetical protein